MTWSFDPDILFTVWFSLFSPICLNIVNNFSLFFVYVPSLSCWPIFNLYHIIIRF